MLLDSLLDVLEEDVVYHLLAALAHHFHAAPVQHYHVAPVQSLLAAPVHHDLAVKIASTSFFQHYVKYGPLIAHLKSLWFSNEQRHLF
jgi:hypothetical protein